MRILALILAIASTAAIATDESVYTYAMPDLSTYTVVRNEADEYPGYFALTITFHNTFTGSAILEVIANDKWVPCGRRCTLKVPSVTFDQGELVNEFCLPVYAPEIQRLHCQYTPLYPVDFTKQYAWQHSGYQLMLPSGWPNAYLVPGDYTLSVWGSALFEVSSFRVQIRPATDRNGED